MKNVGYRLTLACHNHRLRRLHRHRRHHQRGPRLHLEPGLTLQIDFDSIENIFLQNIFLIQSSKLFRIGYLKIFLFSK